MGDVADARDLERRAAELVIVTQFGSTSMLQRRLRIGHARAAAVMAVLEEHGVVGPDQGPGRSREVLQRSEHLHDVVAAEFPQGGT